MVVSWRLFAVVRCALVLVVLSCCWLLIAGVVVARWLLSVAVGDCYCCVLLMFVVV